LLANELCTVFDCPVVVLLLQIDSGSVLEANCQGLLIFQFFAEFDGFAVGLDGLAVLAFLVELVIGFL
jgi:hypothetical protein